LADPYRRPPLAASGFLLISEDLPSRVLVDAFSRPDRDDFDAAAGPINDSTSSDTQTPVALKLFLERFSCRQVLVA